MSEPVIGEDIATMQDQARQIGELGARLVIIESARDAEYQRAEEERAAHVETMQERDEARALLASKRRDLDNTMRMVDEQIGRAHV